MKNGSYKFEGVFTELLDDHAEYFNASFKYIPLDAARLNKYGLWGVFLESLDKKEVDLIPFFFAQDLYNLKHMELTTAIWIDPLKLLQPWPNEKNRLGVTIRPFETAVWFFFIGTTTIFVFITATFIRHRYKIDNVDTTNHSVLDIIFNQMEYVFRITTNQGSSGSHTRDRTSFKILTGIWLLSMVIVLINGYLGVLTSMLSIPKLEPILFTMKEVAESDELRVTIEKNSGLSTQFLDSAEGYEKIIGDKLREDPSLLVVDVFGALENVVHQKAVYPGTDSMVSLLIRTDEKSHKNCRITSSPELKAYQLVTMQLGFPKGSRYAPVFSEMILRLWANGMVIRYKKAYFQATSKCRTDVPPETRIGSLTLLDLSPAFFILGLGTLLSFVSFLLEIIVARFIE